jgi:hypothetical protein
MYEARVGSGRLFAGKGKAVAAKIGFECVATDHQTRHADDMPDKLTIVRGEWAFCQRGLRADGHEWKSTGGEEYLSFVRRVGHFAAGSEDAARAS